MKYYDWIPDPDDELDDNDYRDDTFDEDEEMEQILLDEELEREIFGEDD